MKHVRERCIYLALSGLVAGILACNVPTPAPSVPSPSPVPVTPSPLPPPDTPPSTSTQIPLPPTPTPTREAATEVPIPTVTKLPTPGGPAPTRPVSTGPLDFTQPTGLDNWRPLSDGEIEATIILRIMGGAPPFTVYHDLEAFTIWERNPTIVFKARDCGALVHTIRIESADGQNVEHDYWIRAPWCE